MFRMILPKRSKDVRSAQQAWQPVSCYLGELLKREIGGGWPDHYFEQVIGSWQGEVLSQEFEGVFAQRLKQ